MASVVNHSHRVERPVKPPLGKFRGAVDAIGPFAIVSSAGEKRRTLLTDSAVNSQSPDEEVGIRTTVSPRATKGFATVNKPRPGAIAPEPERSITAHPANTKQSKKRGQAVGGPVAVHRTFR